MKKEKNNIVIHNNQATSHGDNNFFINFGENLKNKRQKQKKTLLEVAEAVDFSSAAAVGMIESGKRGISIDKLNDLANTLKTTPNELLGWEENKNTKEYEDDNYIYKVDTEYNKNDLTKKILLKINDNFYGVKRELNSFSIDLINVLDNKKIKIKNNDKIEELGELISIKIKF